MALPTYVASGTSNAGATSPRTPAYPALAANDRLLLQIFVRATDAAVTTPSGWTYEFEDVVTGYGTQWVFSRKATGSESGTLSVTWSGTTAGLSSIAQIHAFRGVTTAARWYEPGSDTETIGGTVTNMPTVATTGSDRLALALLGAAKDATISASTGETGGDWTKALTEVTTAVGQGASLQLQTAGMASAGILSGGTGTLGNTVGGHTVRGLALIATSGTLAVSAPIHHQTGESITGNAVTTSKSFMAPANGIVIAHIIAKHDTAAVTAFANHPTDNTGGFWNLVHQNVSGAGPALRAAVFARLVGSAAKKIDTTSFIASSTPESMSCTIFTVAGGDGDNLTNFKSGLSTVGDPAATLDVAPAADSTVMAFFGTRGVPGIGSTPTGFTLIQNETIATHQRYGVFYDAVSPVQSAAFVTSGGTQAVAILVEIPLLPAGPPPTVTGTGARTLNPLVGAATGIFGVPLPLDSYLTGLAQACDYRRVVSSYTGPLIRVRRSSDSTEQDIGYLVDNSLDEAALLTFCGSGDGLLIARYDQSMSGLTADQGGSGSKPTMVIAGVIQRLNGKPCARIVLGNDEYEGTLPFATAYTGTTLSAVWSGQLGSQTAGDRLLSLTSGTSTDYNATSRAALIAIDGVSPPTLQFFNNNVKRIGGVAIPDGTAFAASWVGDGTNAILKTGLGSGSAAFSSAWNFNRIVYGQLLSASITERLNADSYVGSAYLWFSTVNATNLETIRAEVEDFWSTVAAVTGTAARTLNPLTGSATGKHGVVGTAARTLAPLTGAATGAQVAKGTASYTLPALAGAAVALFGRVFGTAARTLPPLVGVATGTQTATGTASRTLAAIVGAASGTHAQPITGTAARTLHPLDAFATGIHAVSGSGARTLAPLTGAATAGHGLAGTASRTLAPLAGVATGLHAIGGPASYILLPLVGSATALFGLVTGTAAGTVAPIVGNAFGTHGGAAVTGTATRTLAPLTAAAVGIHAVGGTGVRTVAPLAGVATGAHGVAGAAARTLAPLAGSATAVHGLATGTAARTLVPIVGTGSGVHGVAGTASRTLALLAGNATAFHGQPVTGTASRTLAPLAGSATGVHGVAGTATRTLAVLTGAAAAKHGVGGPAAWTLVTPAGAASGLHTLTIVGVGAGSVEPQQHGLASGVHGVVGAAAGTVAAVGHALGIGAFTVVGEGSIELHPAGLALGHFEAPLTVIRYQECQLTGFQLTKDNARYDPDRRAYLLEDVLDDPEPPPRRPPTALRLR